MIPTREEHGNTCAVYCFTNNINGKKYVGGTTLLYDRWKNHKNSLIPNVKGLLAAYKEFGFENFTFDIIEECTKETVLDREEFWT